MKINCADGSWTPHCWPRRRKVAHRVPALLLDDPCQRSPDISEACSILGWKFETDLRMGLSGTMEYFRGRAATLPCNAERHGPIAGLSLDVTWPQIYRYSARMQIIESRDGAG